jgi:VIT1/CCC1 family predicted Fe2+/Mn2+ transporter
VAHAFASQLGLIAFATAAIQGLISGAEFFKSVQTALLVLLVFYGLGLILGDLARRVVEESVLAELALAADRSAGHSSQNAAQ